MGDTRLLFHLGLGAVGLLALLSPLWVSLLLVLFRGRQVRGRWLFLVVGPVVAYTILWVFTLIFIVPATFVLVFLAPATKDIFGQMPYWYPLAAWGTEYQYLLAAVTCGGLASWLALWLWPRWPSMLYAMAQPPHPKPAAAENASGHSEA